MAAGRPRSWRLRQLRRVGAGAITCGIALALVVAAPGAHGVPAGASKPTPPSPLDLVAQAGQIANASSATEAQLLALDAGFRDSLNGTTAGYVYAIASDAVQAVVGPLKDLVKAMADLRKDVADAGRDYVATVAAWQKEAVEQRAFIPTTNKTAGAWTNTCWAPKNTACLAAAAKVADAYATGGNIRVCPTPPGAETVCDAATKARIAYQAVTRNNEDLLEDAVEASFAARAIVGDAKDYPGNKLFEAILQVLGEHRISQALGKAASYLSPLRAIVSSRTKAVQSCTSTGWTIASAGWLELQGFAGVPVTPSTVGTCT
ncbi:MAG: hypothetical protein ACRDXC_11580 [Acidimicrobiales bacterium]